METIHNTYATERIHKIIFTIKNINEKLYGYFIAKNYDDVCAMVDSLDDLITDRYIRVKNENFTGELIVLKEEVSSMEVCTVPIAIAKSK